MPTVSENDLDWLGLALRSESEQPHEWVALAWVIRNRVETRNFPNSYARVISRRFPHEQTSRTAPSAVALVREILAKASPHHVTRLKR